MSQQNDIIQKQLNTLGLTQLDLENSYKVKPEDEEGFVIRCLYPYEKRHAIKIIADTSGDLSALTVSEAEYIRKQIFLNLAIKEFPKWWSGVEHCLDDDLIEALWDVYQKLEGSLQAKLKKNKQPANP